MTIIDLPKFKFSRYKKNLAFNNHFIYSYNTKVVEIDHDNFKFKVLGYWSKTTSKHINYAVKELNERFKHKYTLCKE